MLMAVARRFCKNGPTVLIGLYSKKSKAKTAVTHAIRHLDWQEAKQQKWHMDERPREIVYTRSDKKMTIVIDFWQVDKALVDGKFIVL